MAMIKIMMIVDNRDDYEPSPPIPTTVAAADDGDYDDDCNENDYDNCDECSYDCAVAATAAVAAVDILSVSVINNTETKFLLITERPYNAHIESLLLQIYFRSFFFFFILNNG